MKWFKRRVAGLTEEQIRGVRNEFIKLYLGPGDVIETAPPRGSLGVAKVILSGSTIPTFEYILVSSGTEPDSSVHTETNFRFWLKFPAKRFPYWDLQINANPTLTIMDFADSRAAIPIALVKAYSNHWPFLSSDNYLARGGECIA